MSPKRRVRLARTFFILSALALFIAGLVSAPGAVATDQGHSAANAFNYVSVMPGDTLWGLAETYAGKVNKQDWIADIISLNNLSSAELVVGEKLALP
jgi:LysM repeat protein